MSLDDRLRPHLARIAAAAATPTSIIIHSVLYIGWWATGVAEMALAIAMSLEAILLALVIIDKQNIDAAADHEWQKCVFRELLDKLPDARPEVAERD